MDLILSDTGSVSVFLYLFFIIIGLLSVFLVYRLITKENIEPDKLGKFLDYFKWVMVTLAISTVTLIVSDLFKERDQDVKELQYFDKYVSDVKNEREPLVRLQLVKYLSIVAPKGPMKKSWTNYYDALNMEYKMYLEEENKKRSAEKKLEEIQKQIREGNNVSTLKINEQIKLIEESQEKITLFNAPLTSSSGNWKEAEELEHQGFQFLIDKNVTAAINAFTNAENAFNGYHSVYEISRYLRNHRESLSDKNSSQWKFTYSTLIKEAKYNWKMPEEYKKRLIELSE